MRDLKFQLWTRFDEDHFTKIVLFKTKPSNLESEIKKKIIIFFITTPNNYPILNDSAQKLVLFGKNCNISFIFGYFDTFSYFKICRIFLIENVMINVILNVEQDKIIKYLNVSTVFLTFKNWTNMSILGDKISYQRQIVSKIEKRDLVRP